MEEELRKRVYSFLAHPIIIDPNDISREYRNERGLSLSSEEVERTRESQFLEIVESLIGFYSKSLKEIGATQGQMTIYWWVEEAPGQLCHSFVSTSHGKLPFGGEIIPAASLSEIVSSFMRIPTHDGIPGSEFSNVEENETEGEEEGLGLAVWSQEIPYYEH